MKVFFCVTAGGVVLLAGVVALAVMVSIGGAAAKVGKGQSR